jgi:hypothetical protein
MHGAESRPLSMPPHYLSLQFGMFAESIPSQLVTLQNQKLRSARDLLPKLMSVEIEV